MDISITGRHMDVGDALKAKVTEAIQTTLSKYFDRIVDCNVVMDKQGNFFSSDITVLVGTGGGFTLRGHAEADDAYVSFDKSLQRIAKQLRRYKKRIKDHYDGRYQGPHNSSPTVEYVFKVEEEDADDGATGDNPAVIAEMDTHIHSMSVKDAVMHMDLADQPVYVFRNSKSGNINVVYRRRDGNIGWFDPAPAAPASVAKSA